ncbi:MAG: ABC transporter ATP-binding protein [Candidatus Zhuqueibacterota bacterium]
MSALFEIKNLTFAVANKRILNDISLTIGQGEYLTIIGPNGAGKTTLLKCLMRIYSGNANAVYFKEKSLRQYTQKQLARQVSYVSQNTDGFNPFTVEEFLLMARYPHLSPFSSVTPDDKKMVEQALQLTGTEHLARRRIVSLSGGERQTVLIAAAFAQGATTMLLDEPTTFLDPKHESDIYRILAHLNRDLGITIIAVTHDINNAVLNSHRTVILKQGTVLFAGKSGDIMQNSLLEQAFDRTFTFFNHPITGQRFIVPEVHPA